MNQADLPSDLKGHGRGLLLLIVKKQVDIVLVHVGVCLILSSGAGVPHLPRSVLHTVTLGYVCPGTEHSALGQPHCFNWGISAHSQ